MSKTVLITGASSGIGKATAKTLIAQGYTVYTAARRIEKMDDLAELGCIPLKMDISKEDNIVAAVNRITKDHGGIDILINNAGFGMQGSVEESSVEDARYQFEVNLFGLGRLTQLALPYMRGKGAGKIINISSVGGKIYAPMGAWYMATKHGLEGWSDCLRSEVKQFGIDVIIIEPGAIKTEFDDVYVGPMLERSGIGPYAKMAHAMATFSKLNRDKKDQYSPPSVIATAINTAIHAKKPKARYAAGHLAKQLLFVRKWGGDCFYDWMIGKMLQQAEKEMRKANKAA